MRDLKAIAQTFFLDDYRIGLASVLALAAFAPQLALSGLVVAVASRLCAERLAVGANLVRSGAVTLNGWFTGLAIGAFFAPGLGLALALAVAVPLAIASTVVCERLLSPWQLPLLVAPYIPAFTVVWLSFSGLPWIAVADAQVLRPAGNPFELLGLGTLRSIGQIFFTQDARLGALLLVVLAVRKPRLGLAMLASAAGAETLAWLIGLPTWQIEQGLHGFAPALMAAAWITGFKGLRWPALVGTIVASPFVESGVLRVSANLGMFGLSTSYLVLVWALLLLRPVHDTTGMTQAWGKLGQGFNRA